MQDSDILPILFLTIIGIFLYIAILRYIISTATQTKTNLEYQRIQIRLLKLLCKKMGVEQEDIDGATKSQEPVKPAKKLKSN